MGLLPKEMQAVGAREESARAPTVVSLEWLQRECEKQERVLRLQEEDGTLPAEDEAELTRLSMEDTTGALRRWAYLKHCWIKRSERLVRQPEAAPEEAQTAAFDLLSRAPEVITLSCGVRVPVTGRSIHAMAEIAAHEARIRSLEAEREEARKVFVATARAMEGAPWRRSRQLRKRLRRIEDLWARASGEILSQWRALWAHATTPTGAPFRPGDALPVWLPLVTPEDCARLFLALMEVGPARYAKLGPPPEETGQGAHPGENFGFATLLAAWGVRIKVRPAELYDQDLGQMMAEMRASAPPPLEEELAG